jgi:hypothetical protein
MPADGVRVLVKRSRIRHVASGIIRYNRDVIAYLLILWKACLGIERIAHLDIRSPRCSTIGAK